MTANRSRTVTRWRLSWAFPARCGWGHSSWQAALEQAGSGLQDVVRTRVILTNIDDWKAAIDVRKEYFADVRPVDTIMAVDRFVNPEWLVELEADAVIAGWTP